MAQTAYWYHRAKIIPIAKIGQTQVTTGNLSDANTLNHPDEYNHIFSLFLLDFMYLYAQVGSLSAVQVDVAGGGAKISGTLARALHAANAIRASEAIFIDSQGQPQNI